MAIIFGIDDRQALREQVLYHPVWKTVLDWLAQLDKNTEPGEHTLDARQGIIATVVEDRPQKDLDQPFEAHMANVDVHFCLLRTEVIHCAPTGQAESQGEPDMDKDVTFYSANTPYSDLFMLPGHVAIFFPEDAHRPLQSQPGRNRPVRKVIVKIPVKALQ